MFVLALMKKNLLFISICSVFLLAPDTTSWAKEDSTFRKIQVKVTHIKHREVVTDTEYAVEAPPEIIAKVVMEGLAEWSRYVPGYPYSAVVGKENVHQLLKARPKKFNEALQLLGNETLPVKERVIRTGPNEITLFTLQQVKLPWPVSRRWSLAKVAHQSNPANNSFVQPYEMTIGDCIKAGGRWEVKANAEHPGWSNVFNQHILDFGIQVPSFVIKAFSKKIARDVHRALRERAESLAKDELAKSH